METKQNKEIKCIEIKNKKTVIQVKVSYQMIKEKEVQKEPSEKSNKFMDYIINIIKESQYLQYAVLILLIWHFKGSIFKVTIEIIAWIMLKLFNKIFTVPNKIKYLFTKRKIEFVSLSNHVDNQSINIINELNQILEDEFLEKSLELKLESTFTILTVNKEFLTLNDEKIFKFKKKLNDKYFVNSQNIQATIIKR